MVDIGEMVNNERVVEMKFVSKEGASGGIVSTVLVNDRGVIISSYEAERSEEGSVQLAPSPCYSGLVEQERVQLFQDFYDTGDVDKFYEAMRR